MYERRRKENQRIFKNKRKKWKYYVFSQIKKSSYFMGCNKNLKKSADYLSRDSTFVFVTV